jgi:hypothetical protein
MSFDVIVTYFFGFTSSTVLGFFLLLDVEEATEVEFVDLEVEDLLDALREPP